MKIALYLSILFNIIFLVFYFNGVRVHHADFPSVKTITEYSWGKKDGLEIVVLGNYITTYRVYKNGLLSGNAYSYNNFQEHLGKLSGVSQFENNELSKEIIYDFKLDTKVYDIYPEQTGKPPRVIRNKNTLSNMRFENEKSNFEVQ